MCMRVGEETASLANVNNDIQHMKCVNKNSHKCGVVYCRYEEWNFCEMSYDLNSKHNHFEAWLFLFKSLLFVEKYVCFTHIVIFKQEMNLEHEKIPSFLSTSCQQHQTLFSLQNAVFLA